VHEERVQGPLAMSRHISGRLIQAWTVGCRATFSAWFSSPDSIATFSTRNEWFVLERGPWETDFYAAMAEAAGYGHLELAACTRHTLSTK
jgi:hypothetical protein